MLSVGKGEGGWMAFNTAKCILHMLNDLYFK